MRFTLEQKALRVIDWLVSDDLSEDCCMKAAFNHPYTQEEAKAMSDKITRIYKISHSAIPEHSCFYVHIDWRKKTVALFRKLRKHHEIPVKS
uniref:Uncharacterized protein n=1 Tax=viral metagenome TaxID=1070528 RepID=A0A6H1ZTK3_9ZZZZ